MSGIKGTPPLRACMMGKTDRISGAKIVFFSEKSKTFDYRLLPKKWGSISSNRLLPKIFRFRL